MNLTERKNKTKLSPHPPVRLFRLSQRFWGRPCSQQAQWLTGAAGTAHTVQLLSAPLSPALCKPLEDSRKGAQRAQGAGEQAATWRRKSPTPAPPPPSPSPLRRAQGSEEGAPGKPTENARWRGLLRKGCLKRCYCLGHLLAKNYVNGLLKRSWKCVYNFFKAFQMKSFECFKVLG